VSAVRFFSFSSLFSLLLSSLFSLLLSLLTPLLSLLCVLLLSLALSFSLNFPPVQLHLGIRLPRPARARRRHRLRYSPSGQAFLLPPDFLQDDQLRQPPQRRDHSGRRALHLGKQQELLPGAPDRREPRAVHAVPRARRRIRSDRRPSGERAAEIGGMREGVHPRRDLPLRGTQRGRGEEAHGGAHAEARGV